MGLFSLAGPPLGKVSRLDHTDGVGRSDLPHFPDLPDEVSSDIILQDGVTVDPFTPSHHPSHLHYYHDKKFNCFIASMFLDPEDL